ncbi:MAG: antibiotic biosynthesis monooxygenase family protein [Planctomycetaceae bacterium]
MNIILTVTDERDVPEITALLTEHGNLSRQEPGCARFELYHSKHDSKMFVICEHWESETALDEHRKAQGYTTIYLPQVLSKVTRTGHPCELLG